MVDYSKEDFAEKYKNDPFDAIVDLVGGDSEVKSYGLLKKGGTFAHIRYVLSRDLSLAVHYTALLTVRHLLVLMLEKNDFGLEEGRCTMKWRRRWYQ